MSAHSFPTLTRLNINIMHKVIRWGKTVMHMVNGWGKTYPVKNVLVRGWGKTGLAHSFPTLTRLKINLVQKVIGWGKTVVHMVNGVEKNTANLTLS